MPQNLASKSALAIHGWSIISCHWGSHIIIAQFDLPQPSRAAPALQMSCSFEGKSPPKSKRNQLTKARTAVYSAIINATICTQIQNQNAMG